ncbi:MAG TPA: hypothetical protein VMY34_09215 [Acidimicrobiales bacterium]|nr:hypothetical protein [Acidimicrobiales bacterium]
MKRFFTAVLLACALLAVGASTTSAAPPDPTQPVKDLITKLSRCYPSGDFTWNCHG